MLVFALDLRPFFPFLLCFVFGTRDSEMQILPCEYIIICTGNLLPWCKDIAELFFNVFLVPLDRGGRSKDATRSKGHRY